MNDGKIRVGVVGTGYLGRLHARLLTEIANADVVGFVEPSDAAAAEVVEKLNLRRFESLDALAKEIECAVVATPTIAHYQVATQLLESGCDVMIEKPITPSPDQALDLIRLAKRESRIIQVGHVERYNPAIQAAAPFIEKPRYVEAERLGVFAPRSLDVDVLLDLMIHDLQLVVSLLQKKVVEIRAVGVPVLTDKVDIANVRLELEDGSVANLTASRVSSDRVRKFRVFGHDSYLSIDTREQEVKGYRLVKNDRTRAIEPLEIHVERKEPLRAELESFLECVATRGEPLVSAEDGLRALELAVRVGDSIERSMSRG